MKPRHFSPNRFLTGCGLALAFAALSVRADVRLHGLFTDNMVLQRGIAVPVWGWADEGEQIVVQFRGQTVRTRATGGQWRVNLRKMKAGGPFDLRVQGRNGITLRNVMVGEVWIASGQSNMEWPMRLSFDPDNEIAKTANPQLRLFTVPKLKLNAPTNNVAGQWAASSPTTTSNFSAVAYYFGRDLQRALKVPVGIIHTSWGGSPAEVWMSERVLSGNPDYQRDILDAYAEATRKLHVAVAQFEQEEAAARSSGTAFTKRRPAPPWKPCELYNGMIANLIPFAIQGAIWYQGESNAGRAHQYRTLFPDMIYNWRTDWGQGDFPFMAVQLAPFMEIKEQPGDSSWAELREAQVLATQVLPNVGVAVITDVGDEKDIHPKRKEPVGGRLALAARGIAYRQRLEYSGPMYRAADFRDGKAILHFDHVGDGLDASVGELRGFAIAGEDRRFVWAHAEIVGNRVVVSSPDVPQPMAVRYGWADFPVVNLRNKNGLLASPFRTDDFPLTTKP